MTLVLFIVVVGILNTNIKYEEIFQDSQTIESKWIIECGEETYTRKLPAKIINESYAPIRFSTIIDEGIDKNEIMFYAISSEVRVFLDDNILLNAAKKEERIIQFPPPSKYYIVTLPKDFQGKKLTIEMTPASKHAAIILPTVYIGDKVSFIYTIIQKGMPQILFFAIMLFVSILFFCVGLFLKTRITIVGKKLCCFGLFLAVICIWSLMESRILQFFFQNDILAYIILEVCYFLIPILAAKFLLNFSIFNQKSQMKFLYTISKIQFIAAQIVVIMGKSIFFLKVLMQITSIAIVITILYSIFRGRKTPEKMSEIKFLLYGPIVLCISGAIELFRHFFDDKLQNGGFLVVGLDFFALYYGVKIVQEFVKHFVASNKENTELHIVLEANNIKMKVAQMHPHFLYNALTAIQTIIKVNPDYAYRLMFDFTIHLRGTVKALTSDAPIPFSEELKHIKAYLNIEQMRFGDSLKVVYDIRNDDFYVTPLVIQPLAENAARHGIFERGEDGGVVTIRSYEEENDYVIQVIDTGMGFDVEKTLFREISTDSVGLKNIIFRLEKLLQAEVEIDSVIGVGTTVTVRIHKERNISKNYK